MNKGKEPAGSQSTASFLTSIPTEVRFEILKHLLPDLDSIPFRPAGTRIHPSSHVVEALELSDDSSVDGEVFQPSQPSGPLHLMNGGLPPPPPMQMHGSSNWPMPPPLGGYPSVHPPPPGTLPVQPPPPVARSQLPHNRYGLAKNRVRKTRRPPRPRPRNHHGPVGYMAPGPPMSGGTIIDPYISLRKDGTSCTPAIMRVCRQIYEECLAIVFAPSRMFEATLGHGSSWNLELLHLRTWNLDPTTRRRDPRLNPDLRQLVELLGRIKSLWISIPLQLRWGRKGYLVSSAPTGDAIQAFVNLITDHFGGRSPFRFLSVDLTAVNPELPPHPPPPYLPFDLRALINPGCQADIKQKLLPLQSLYGFEPRSVEFLLLQQPFEEFVEPPLTNLATFTQKLAQSMSRNEPACRSLVLLSSMRSFPKLITCFDAITKARRIVEERPLDVSEDEQDKDKDEEPELWLWDAWQRGAWDEIELEYDIVKVEWQRLRATMDDMFHDLDKTFVLEKANGPHFEEPVKI